jgi:hypothetical protein
MLLMSWAGEQARKDLMLAMGRDLTAETNGADAELRGRASRYTATERAMESRDQKCGAGGF